jgi:hypothetical protein
VDKEDHRVTTKEFFASLRWIDKKPLVIEPYRQHLFTQFFDERDETGWPRFNIGVFGRGKKNAKTLDLCLAELRAVTEESPSGSQCYLLANDKDQAADDLELLKKLIKVNGFLADWLNPKKSIIERRDGKGFIEVLPAQDVAGSHGKTYRLCGLDEIHGFRNWDLLEAMQFDPTRPEAQQWITSYASLYHKPGVPLFDLCKIGRAGSDPRMLFSWYAADFTTDPTLADATPEARANPSMASWADAGYLTQQQRRLPSHKFRRLHLNLPGLPEGSAFQPEPVADAIDRGWPFRLRAPAVNYFAFCDMSGGSSDDAVLAIAHSDSQGVALDRVVNQGQPPPFDPRQAVRRFATILREYRLSSVTGDAYAGETFRAAFGELGIGYTVSERTASEYYEALEPMLNGGSVRLVDVPQLEQQLLGLIWRGGKITHPSGEHDDFANAAAGALVLAANVATTGPLDKGIMAVNAAAPPVGAATHAEFYGPNVATLLGSGEGLDLGRLATDAFGGAKPDDPFLRGIGSSPCRWK